MLTVLWSFSNAILLRGGELKVPELSVKVSSVTLLLVWMKAESRHLNRTELESNAVGNRHGEYLPDVVGCALPTSKKNIGGRSRDFTGLWVIDYGIGLFSLLCLRNVGGSDGDFTVCTWTKLPEIWPRY